MTAKEYLSQAYVIDKRVRMMREKIDKMRSSLYHPASQQGSNGSTQHSSGDKLGKAVASVVDYEKEMLQLIDKLIETRVQIDNTIGKIEDPILKEVLERRYLLYQDWDSGYSRTTGKYIKGIAEEMNYSVRQVFRFHGEALREVSKLLKDVSECQ